jgi:hypothetical protein
VKGALGVFEKFTAKEFPGISVARNRGSSGKTGLAAMKAVSQAGEEPIRKARSLRHRPRVPLRFGTKRRMDGTRSDKANRVYIPSAENHEMSHHSIERLSLGKVTKYIDNDHCDARVVRVVRPSGKSAGPAAAPCE